MIASIAKSLLPAREHSLIYEQNTPSELYMNVPTPKMKTSRQKFEGYDNLMKTSDQDGLSSLHSPIPRKYR